MLPGCHLIADRASVPRHSFKLSFKYRKGIGHGSILGGCKWMERNHFVRPRFIAPMLCRQIKTLPHGDDWFYEIKHDGHRALAVKDGANVTLFAGDGKVLDYPEVRDMVRQLHARSAVIDCEIIALDKKGKSCFAALRSNGGDCTIRLYAFDLLHLNGRDLTSEPIERRKDRLCTITLDTAAVLFSPSLGCEPNMLIEQVKQLSLGGIIAKRRGSTYEAGKRGGAWVSLPLNGGGDGANLRRNGGPGLRHSTTRSFRGCSRRKP